MSNEANNDLIGNEDLYNCCVDYESEGGAYDCCDDGDVGSSYSQDNIGEPVIFWIGWLVMMAMVIIKGST